MTSTWRTRRNGSSITASGAAALSDAALRPAGRSRQHQLPGPAAHPAASAAMNSAAPCGAPALHARANRRDRHGRHLSLAGHAGFRKDQRVLGSELSSRSSLANRREELLAYKDEQTWREAGQGGFEIRTFIAVAGAD